MIKTIFLKPLIVKDKEILVFRPNLDKIDVDFCMNIMNILKEQCPDCNLAMIPQEIELDAEGKKYLIKEIEAL